MFHGEKHLLNTMHPSCPSNSPVLLSVLPSFLNTPMKTAPQLHKLVVLHMMIREKAKQKQPFQK